ncbi:YgfZ/GcvT domain-containing protein [Marinomonas pollencensis]|uniref:Uncharacterized protein n=1 Tax=Marinomonas pollencensis TaxID=491954 RepID=A0A3E0DL72_9GAMM|nr:folate-binding protein YgfZ [Marinomonas pollencensis]REG82841.1 hypothetical protein DFP81_10714 [Marinomonas pollencensis]
MNILSNLAASLLDQDVVSHSPDLGILRIQGSDAKKLLQGQTSCDMTKLSADHALYGAICSIKGRIISNFYAVQVEEDILLIMNEALLETTLNQLKKYAVFFKAELNLASDDYTVQTEFSAATSTEVPDALIEQLPTETEQGSIQLTISEFPSKASIRLLPNSQAQSETAKAPAQAELLSLLTARPLINAEHSEEVLPQWLNMQRTGGISFTKGCYTGQEIVARMQYRGKSKKQLALFSWEGNSEVAPTLLDSDGKNIGSLFKKACFNGLNIAQIIINIEPTDVDHFFLGDQAVTLLPLPYQLDTLK